MIAAAADAGTLPPVHIEQLIASNTSAALSQSALLHPCGDDRAAAPPSGNASWLPAAQRSFSAIKALPDRWDGPRSSRISDAIIYRADRILRDALENVSNAVAPYIVPRADGSLQFEWNTDSHELEFYLNKDGSVSAWVADRNSGAEFEGEGDKAFDILFRWAARVAAKSSDAADVQVPQAAPRILLAA